MSRQYKATVFIPTWFGEKYIEELLTMVLSQQTDFKYEVLIYDTSSADKTPDIIQKFVNKHDNVRFKSITKDKFGHGKTRQAAAKDAKGEIVVYLSQDARPAHDRWLHEIVKPFDLSEKIVGVIGRQEPRHHAFPLLKYEIWAVFNNFGVSTGTTLYYRDDFVKDQATYDHISFYSDVNSAARRSFLVNIIPYRDVPYSEDQLFGRELIDAGYRKAYAPRASVVHSNDIKLREYQNRMFDETIGLRKVGVPVKTPGRKIIAKLITRGVVRDWLYTLRDPHYSPTRKMYWLAVNPLFHIEKWRGVRRASLASLDDTELIEKYSLENIRDNQRKA